MLNTLSVHMMYPADDAALALLRAQLAGNIKLTFDAIPDDADYEILVVSRPSRKALVASPRLRALVYPFAGLPAPTRTLMRAYPHISIHNSHHHKVSVTEMALALLLAAARRLIPADRDFRKHDWTPRYLPYPSIVLHGKTALILGYGAIGQQLGSVLKVLGMRVLGVRRNHADEAQGIYKVAALHDLLPQAHALIVTAPGTAETLNLIGEYELSLLPKDAIVVNVGRAEVIDQKALYQALQSDLLHSAGIDVWYHYPTDEEARTHTPPADEPFHELDQIVMSPHRAGAGRNPEMERLRMMALAELLNHAARGEPLPNQVSLEQGY